MSYYQGDFYRGDFYQGDPGFFGVLKGLAGAAAGFIPGVGPIASGLIKAIPSGGGAAVSRAGIASSMLRLPAGTAMMKGAGTSLIRRGVAAVKGHPVLSAAGAAGAIGAGAMATSPSLRRAAGRMLIGGKRRRRMNVCNPRALRRAIRRTHGFAKLAMKTIHIVHPKKRGTFGGFRRRRIGSGSRRR